MSGNLLSVQGQALGEILIQECAEPFLAMAICEKNNSIAAGQCNSFIPAVRDCTADLVQKVEDSLPLEINALKTCLLKNDYHDKKCVVERDDLKKAYNNLYYPKK